MTTATDIFAAIKARLSSASLSVKGVPVTLGPFFADEPAYLPNAPEPFVYCDVVTRPGRIAGFGGGRGANLYRNPGRLEAYCFVPAGKGVAPSLALAEQVATLFRSWRSGDLSFFAATAHPGGPGADLKPPGLRSDVGLYFWSAAECEFTFDQVG